MPEINQKLYRQLIGLLVIVAIVATLARLIFYTIHWRDLASAAAGLSWLEWSGVALFVAALVWSAGRRDKID